MSNILGCDKIFLPNMKYKRLVVKEIVVKQIVLNRKDAIFGELHPSCFCLDEGFIMGACKLWE